MDLKTKFKLGLWLAQKRHRPFEWGRNDCNTLVLEMHDFLYDTNTLAHVYEQYRNRSGAIRFAKRFTSAPDQLQSLGYKQGIRPTTGDVLLQDSKLYYTAWIVFGNSAYSISEESNTLVEVKLEALDKYTIWRL